MPTLHQRQSRSSPSVPPCLRASVPSSSAFTLIEVLVVISVILILIGLFIGGSRAWINSSNRNLTLTRLQALSGMLAELQAAGQNQYASQWFFQTTVTAVQPNAFELDASQLASVGADSQGSTYIIKPSNASPPLAFPSGGTYTCSRSNALTYMDFNGTPTGTYTPAIVLSNTGSKMAMSNVGPMYLLASVPNNSKALAALGPNATIPNPAGGPPLVVDGWGNPILFCPGSVAIGTPAPSGTDLGNGPGNPAGGLTNVCLNVQPASPQTSPPTFNATVTTITSPDGRPFFASAGPDGDFAKGDDNIYSFEQK